MYDLRILKIFTMKKIYKEFSNIDPYYYKTINQNKLRGVNQTLKLFKNQSIKNPKSINSLNLVKEINSLYKLLSADTSEEKMANFPSTST